MRTTQVAEAFTNMALDYSHMKLGSIVVRTHIAGFGATADAAFSAVTANKRQFTTKMP